MLDQHAGRLKSAEGAQNKSIPEGEAFTLENVSGLKKIELEITAAAGLLRPLSAVPAPTMPAPASPSLEELIRAISKFEKSEVSQVVDLFE
jgi:hypothetical protein